MIVRTVIRRGTLKRAARSRPHQVLRLADFLGLRTAGMSSRQVAQLVYWRITRTGFGPMRSP